jgi:hypothetical protein
VRDSLSTVNHSQVPIQPITNCLGIAGGPNCSENCFLEATMPIRLLQWLHSKAVRKHAETTLDLHDFRTGSPIDQLEATASVSFIRFKDDVVVRVMPTSDEKASILEIRSPGG